MGSMVGWLCMAMVIIGAGACHHEDRTCPEIDAPSIGVTLRDSQTQTSLCGGTVVAVQEDGNYTETLQSGNIPPCVYSGLHARAGHFRLEASLKGYNSKRVEGFSSTDCYEGTKNVVIDLDPQK